ncbi:putative zinc finger transcription factor ace1 protein [Phaeoacremonium minimum UCRPA7]|uniref:Putative zinc finger transcription factor ace1 protein n=1 Tax=Phaeoacremonium minimum (strain UCR-PA7) TaxID=1286976 RepID=R8BD91_PHAM7|nr:putative zinc finger transcription factor ace1 protein [Phaeoacremonium minimum UCRPA7]EON97265.1 putative zinc finger transcription factor ace1 protein [Phaeoacremonium minimum UCRPA7]
MNPRRTSPVTRPDSTSGNGLVLKTNMILRKGATFHSPTSPSSSESIPFRPPPLPRRSQTSLDDVVDAHRRRVALTLGNIDKTLSAATGSSSSSRKTFRDDSLPIPRGFLDHTITMTKDAETERRVLRPRSNRRASRCHESDSGLGTSIATSTEKRAADANVKKEKTSVKATAITRSAAAASSVLPGLSSRATNRIIEHTLKPLLAKPSLKTFHPLVLDCPRRIQEKEILCLRDLEKTLLLIAPERTKVAGLYLDFCLTTIRCIQATVEYLSDREQTRPRDLPYTSGYFIDLVDQIRQYAQQLADAKEKETTGDEMDVDPTDEVKLHGGIHINGRPAELVRVKKNGKAISMATGEPVEIEEEAKGPIKIKRSASEELEDEEEIMRSMARRKKNATPEELAPKKCREPGCNKEFKRPCDLTKHEKTHSRPWKCPVPTCKYHEYGWPTEKEMDRHHNDKHSSAPPMYECLYKPCPYKSKRESNCKQHMEKAHGWTYVRTKTNGKKSVGKPDSTAQPTPLLQNIPTPISDNSIGIATPPEDQFGRIYPPTNFDFPTYVPEDPFHAFNIPQELQLDYSPIDNATPSTDTSMDHSTTYQDNSTDYTAWEDIYSANTVQVPTPPFNKEIAQQFAAFTEAELGHPQPAPHISPIGQGNAMLFTPASLAEVDEGFEEFPANGSGGDFLLFPPAENKSLTYDQALFGEIPSVAAGYSQPSSQDFMPMDWTTNGYSGYDSQH